MVDDPVSICVHVPPDSLKVEVQVQPRWAIILIHGAPSVASVAVCTFYISARREIGCICIYTYMDKW